MAFRRSGLPALMTVFRNEGRWDTSNVLFDGARVVRYDKRAPTPGHALHRLWARASAAETLGRQPADTAFDLAEVYARCAAEGQLAGYEATRRFYEIGTPRGLAETDAFLKGT